MVIYHHGCDASNSFSGIAVCLVNTHQESVCSSIFCLRARDSWDYALLLLCCLGAASYLQKHKRRIHSNSILYECPYCGKLFKIHGQLKHHVHIHTDAKPYSCRHCSHGFRRPDQLKTHLLKSHNEGTWFTCDICQKKFSSKQELKVHVQRHEAVKPYVFSECAMRFCTATELRQHHPVHWEYKQFSCVLCDRLYKRKRTVKIHFKKCSAEHGVSHVQLYSDISIVLLVSACVNPLPAGCGRSAGRCLHTAGLLTTWQCRRTCFQWRNCV